MLRRFLLGLPIWTLVVGASAAPSWFFASSTSVEGRLFGIAAWILIYSFISSTDFFTQRWLRRPERVALIVTYSIRSLLGVGMLVFEPLALVDVLAGLLSVRIAERLTGHSMFNHSGQGGMDSFLPTAIATFTQGLLLSIVTLGLLVIVRAICLASMAKTTDGPRGFEVIMPPSPDDRTPPNGEST